MPRWRRDGRELLFLDYDGRVFAATVDIRDSSLTVGNPGVLFETLMGPHLVNRSFAWDVDAAGSRFYCLEPRQRQDERQAMVVIRNWRPSPVREGWDDARPGAAGSRANARCGGASVATASVAAAACPRVAPGW